MQFNSDSVSSRTNTASLLPYLADLMLTPVTRRRWFSGEYVLFIDYMACAQFLYEMGLVLGYTFRDRLVMFAELFFEPDRDASNVASCLRELSRRHLAGLTNEPNDLMELFSVPEVERIMRVLRDHGLTRYTDFADFPKVAMQKIRRDNVFIELQLTVAEAIGVGSHFPELTERLLLGTEDIEAWQDALAHGLDIPASPPKAKSIPQRQAEAIATIRPFIEKIRPDLLKTLAL